MPLPEYSWLDHATWFATTRQFNQLGRNLDKEGLAAWLGGHAITTQEPWDGFTAITDQLCDAEVLDADQAAQSTTVRLAFESHSGRDDFARLTHKSLAGIPPRANPPFLEIQRGETPKLVIEDLRYSDLSKLGQIGTATFRRAIEKNDTFLRIVNEIPVGLLDIDHAAFNLTDTIKERIVYQREAVGPHTFLTSGHLAIIGQCMREQIAPRAEDLAAMSRRQQRRAALQVQRPFGERPTLDEYVNFFPTPVARPTDAPFSTISAGQLVGRQLGERLHEVKKSIRDRQPQSLEQFADFITGLGLNQGVGIAARGLYTLATASGWATWQTVRDHFRK